MHLVWRWSWDRILSSLELVSLFALKASDSLDEAQPRCGGSSALLQVHGCKCQPHLKNAFTVMCVIVSVGLRFSQVDVKLILKPCWVPISSFEPLNVTLNSLSYVFMDFFPSLNLDLSKGQIQGLVHLHTSHREQVLRDMPLSKPSSSIVSVIGQMPNR